MSMLNQRTDEHGFFFFIKLVRYLSRLCEELPEASYWSFSSYRFTLE